MKRISWLLLSMACLMALPAVAAETYEIDPAHTFVVFKVDHLGLGHVHGRFNEVAGSFVIDEEDPAASSVEITVQAASIDTGVDRRDEHLRSPDFLHAAQFPVISFESRQVEEVGDGRWEITGDFEIRGRSRPLTVTFEKLGEGEDPWGNHRLGGTTSFVIERSKYGVSFMPDAISEEVSLTFAVEAARK